MSVELEKLESVSEPRRPWHYTMIAVLVCLLVAGFIGGTVWLGARFSSGYEGYGELVTNAEEARNLPKDVKAVRLFGVDDSTIFALEDSDTIEHVLLSQKQGKAGELTELGAAALARMPNLHQLVIVDAPEINASFMESLAKSQSIRTISIEGCRSIDKSAVAALERLTTLRELDIFQTIDRSVLEGLASLWHLERCSFRMRTIDANDMPSFGKLRSLRRLKIELVESDKEVKEQLEATLRSDIPWAEIVVVD